MQNGKIEKATGANTNTFATIVNGWSVSPATMKHQSINAQIMFSCDEEGETLSVYDTATKKQVIVPFEAVEKLIEHARQKRQEGVDERCLNT